MKTITAKSYLQDISLWSFLHADEYHAIKTAMRALDALNEIAKELRSEADKHEFPNDFVIALGIVKKYIAAVEKNNHV